MINLIFCDNSDCNSDWGDFKMEEKRGSKRYPASIRLEVSELFKQGNIKVENIDAPLEVINISRTGLGIRTKSILPLGYYFNAKLEMGSSEASLYCVVKIIRVSPDTDGIPVYGCEFVGMAPVLNFLFEDYEKRLDAEGVSD